MWRLIGGNDIPGWALRPQDVWYGRALWIVKPSDKGASQPLVKLDEHIMLPARLFSPNFLHNHRVLVS